MSITLAFKLTSAGMAACWNAKKTGISVDLTHVQLGSGNRVPDGLEAALAQPKETAAIAIGTQIAPNQIRMSALFVGNALGYDIAEIGLWAGNPAVAGSVLIGYWSQAAGILAAKAPGVDFVFGHDMVITDAVSAGALTVLADTSLAPALALVAAHEAKVNPHPQYALAADLAGVVSAGCVAFFATATAPATWLKANGAAVSRIAFDKLYAAVGTQFGIGDGATTFNLPDLRGEFVRGLDDGRGTDTGRALGSTQLGTPVRVKSPYGATWILSQLQLPGKYVDALVNPAMMLSQYPLGSFGAATSYEGNVDSYGTVRPRNVSLLACIKY
ncbi:tail fiber protein [Paraburkholderia fungorum]|uniref:tail fiber protein n=1 Tax=Paraburkholderia fungorum TaxID=134537 RepID=UPI00402B66BB